jgi:predicted TIM-barrel fold metal-dependent hydrolase
MLDDGTVVFDAVAHAYNLSDANYRKPPYAKALVDSIWESTYATMPPGHRLPKSVYCRDWQPEEMARILFLETDTDIAVNHVLAVNAFSDGLSSVEKAMRLKERWPHRFVFYAAVDPLNQKRALEELERQVELLQPEGVKLYPTSWDEDRPRGWRLDDPEVAFPIYERVRELGLKVVAVHKIAAGPKVPVEWYRADDVEAAALAYPDLTFEIVHGGVAFVEETAWMLRHPNVYVNIETLATMIINSPKAFAEGLAGLLAIGGPRALDRIIWGTGSTNMHPQPAIEAFSTFTFPEEVISGRGLWGGIPQLTDESRRKILGENRARMTDIDLEARMKLIADDEFTQERERSGRARPFAGAGIAEHAE